MLVSILENSPYLEFSHETLILRRLRCACMDVSLRELETNGVIERFAEKPGKKLKNFDFHETLGCKETSADICKQT